MAIISTKELLAQYFATRNQEQLNRVIGSIERPELFKYESEIGKQLVDMNTEEVVELFRRLPGLQKRSVIQLQSYYRRIIDFYSENYEHVQNPFSSKELKGEGLVDKLDWEKFDNEYIERNILKIRTTYSDNIDKADYLECIVRMFVDGFSCTRDIVELKKEDINFDEKTVTIGKRKVALSNRTFNLLKRIHCIDSMSNDRNVYIMCQWNNSYFKFPIRASSELKFKALDVTDVASIINRKMSYDINKVCGISLNYMMLYYFGVYNRFVEYCGGKENAVNVIENYKPREHADLIYAFIEQESLTDTRPSYLLMKLDSYV